MSEKLKELNPKSKIEIQYYNLINDLMGERAINKNIENKNIHELDLIYNTLIKNYILYNEVDINDELYKKITSKDITGKYSYLIAKNIKGVNMDILENNVINTKKYIYSFIRDIKNCNYEKIIKAFLAKTDDCSEIINCAKVINGENIIDNEKIKLLFIEKLLEIKNVSLNDLVNFSSIYEEELTPLTRYMYAVIDKDNYKSVITYFECNNISDLNILQFEEKIIALNKEKKVLLHYLNNFSKIKNLEKVVSIIINESDKKDKVNLINSIDKIDFNSLSKETIKNFFCVTKEIFPRIRTNKELLKKVFMTLMSIKDIVNIDELIVVLKKIINSEVYLEYICEILIKNGLSEKANDLLEIVIDKAGVPLLNSMYNKNLYDNNLLLNEILYKATESDLKYLYDLINDNPKYQLKIEEKFLELDETGDYLNLYINNYNSFDNESIFKKLIMLNCFESAISLLIKYPYIYSESMEKEVTSLYKIHFNDLYYLFYKNIFKFNKEEVLGKNINYIADFYKYLSIVDVKNEQSIEYIKQAIVKFSLYTVPNYKEGILNSTKLSIENKKLITKLIDNCKCIALYLNAFKLSGNEDLLERLMEIDNSGKYLAQVISVVNKNIDKVIKCLLDKDETYLVMYLKKKNVILPPEFSRDRTADNILSIIKNDEYKHLRKQLELILIEKDVTGKYLRNLFELKISTNQKRLYNAIVSKKNFENRLFRSKYKKYFENEDETSNEIGKRNLDIDIINELLECDAEILAKYKQFELKKERLIQIGHNIELLDSIEKCVLEGLYSVKGNINDMDNRSDILELFSIANNYLEASENQYFYKYKFIEKKVNQSCKGEMQIIKNTLIDMTKETNKFTNKLKEL